ncbi:hypothetical protein ACOCHS_06435 [Propionibacteriaceae bacterium Y2011]
MPALLIPTLLVGTAVTVAVALLVVTVRGIVALDEALVADFDDFAELAETDEADR